MVHILSPRTLAVSLVSLLLIGGVLSSKEAQAGASPIACTIYTNPVEADSAGVNECETEPATYCEEGWLCCNPAYPTQISQDLFSEYRRDFIMDSFYTGTVEPDFKKYADEIYNASAFRLGAIGAFFDASIFNDTLKDIGVYSTQSLQAYTPSEQICKFGTLSKALAASEAKMDTDRLMMSEIGLAKNLGTQNSMSAAGRGLEFQMRLKSFVDSFCSLDANNSGMDDLCQLATPVKDLQQNRDVDYTRLLGNGVTIDADLTDPNGTQDEYNLIAMAHYLYGHRQPVKRFSGGELRTNDASAVQYAEYRSVAARRAAAQNTYNTLASMKMAGSGGSESYLRDVLSYIGIAGGEADKYLGAKNTDNTKLNSSYNAQMNLLTKQIYQDPTFYANLMDSKANVKRTSAALQGFGLMQARDTYKSMARSEMLMAILVQLEAREIANNVNGTKEK